MMLPDSAQSFKWQNIQLKPRLKEAEDYIILDESIWNYLKDSYGVDQEIRRIGIEVDETSGEAQVEVYLKPIMIYPMPNSVTFKFKNPMTIYIGRMETLKQLYKKLQRVLNLYIFQNKKGVIPLIVEMRLWKPTTGNFEDL